MIGYMNFLRCAEWTSCGFFVFVSLIGCGSDKTGLGRLCEVTGEVTFKGVPCPGAIVHFVPKTDDVGEKLPSVSAGEPQPFAIVEEDGTFSVTTAVPEGSKKGAPPGEYLIAITWSKPLDPTDKDSGNGPNLLPDKYKSPKYSTLEVEVTEGKNVIPAFELEP